MRPRRLAAIGLAAACLGCGGAAPTPSAPAPLSSVAIVAAEAGLSVSEATTVTRLRQQLAAAGLQLSAVNQPVQPAVPLSFAAVPVVVYRMELADPDQGFVLIYDFPDAAAAAAGAMALAHFVSSGFGQTTYPVDAVFSITSLGADVIFSWWSPSRASDPALTQAAFQRVASVGSAVTVTK
jgi:hypothetical protein